jgi:hypothetical protein
LHRFDCISNQVHNDLLDLKTIYEHQKDRFLIVVLNWNQLAGCVLFDEAYGISNEIHDIAGRLYDWLLFEQRRNTAHYRVDSPRIPHDAHNRNNGFINFRRSDPEPTGTCLRVGEYGSQGLINLVGN